MANKSGKPSKYCSVPMCTNTSAKTPQKLFIHMPDNPTVRKKWCTAIGTDVLSLGWKTKRYCCEDHFDLKKNLRNYKRFKLNGGRIKLKKGVLPHKFECRKPDNDTERHKRPDWPEGQDELSKNIGHEDLHSDTVVSVDIEEVTTNVPLNNINNTEEATQVDDKSEMSQPRTKNKPKVNYKNCCVPMCCNTNKSTPHKSFYPVPMDARMRHKWFTAIGRQNDGLSPKSKNLHVCEDHFNLPEDHYMQYHLLEPSRRPQVLRLKPHVVPSRFHCWAPIPGPGPGTKRNKSNNVVDKPRTITRSTRGKQGRSGVLPKNNKLWQISIDNNPTKEINRPEPIDEPTTQTAKQLHEYKKNIEQGVMSPTKQLELIKQTIEKSLISHTKLLESTVTRDNFELPKKPREQVPKKPKEKTEMEKMPRALREQEIRLVVTKSEQESSSKSEKEKDVNEQDPLTLGEPHKCKNKDKSRTRKRKRPKCKPTDTTMEECSQTLQHNIKDVATKPECRHEIQPDDCSILQLDEEIHQDDDDATKTDEIRPDDDDATIMECEETECYASDASVKSERSASASVATAASDKDRENVCRTCLCPCVEGMPLSARDHTLGATLDSLLEEVTGVHVQHDEVPRALCLACECSLRAAALFRRKAIHADRTLRAAHGDDRPASPRHQPDLKDPPLQSTASAGQTSLVDRPERVEPSMQSDRSTGELTPTHDTDDDEREGSRTPQLNEPQPNPNDDFYWPEDDPLPPHCSPQRHGRRKTKKLKIEDIYSQSESETDKPILDRIKRDRSWSPKSDTSTTDDSSDTDTDEPTQKKRKMHPTGKSKKYWKPKTGKYTKMDLQCAECGYMTFNMFRLELHNRKHTGEKPEKPFACSLCDGRFANKTTLTNHQLTHDSRRARTFMCDHCGRGYYRKCNLINHMPMHSTTRFVCSSCGHAFAWRANLRAHLKRVHGK